MAEGTKIDILKDRSVSPAAPEEAEAEKPAPSRRKRALLIGGIAAMTLLGIGGGAVFAIGPSRLIEMVMGPSETAPAEGADPEDALEAQDPAEGHSEGNGEPKADDVLLLDDMIVNLVRIEGSVNRYARVRIAIVYDREALGIGALEAKRSHLRDSFNDYLSQMTERDLQGTFGLVSLKEELLRRARVVAGQKTITDVLVTDLVFQ